MIHWTTKYIGIPYNKRKMNCVTLIKQVYEKELSRTLSIPQLEDFSVDSLDKSLKLHFEDYCREVDRIPKEFDIILMQSMGHFNHVGVATYLNGRLGVLHSFAGARQVCITEWSRLSMYHLSPAGVYECL